MDRREFLKLSAAGALGAGPGRSDVRGQATRTPLPIGPGPERAADPDPQLGHPGQSD